MGQKERHKVALNNDIRGVGIERRGQVILMLKIDLCLGLLFTMQNMPPKGIAVVFTDHQTKNYNLESDINSLRTEKNLDVIVVLAPKYSGSANDASWQVYDRVSDGVFDMETSTLDQLVTEVSQRAEAKC